MINWLHKSCEYDAFNWHLYPSLFFASIKLTSLWVVGVLCNQELLPSVGSIIGVMTMLSIVNMCAGLGTGGYSVNHADIGPKHTGSIMGISATIATIPGIVGVAISGVLVDVTGSFDSVFYLSSAILLFGGIFYLTFASTSKQFD